MAAPDGGYIPPPSYYTAYSDDAIAEGTAPPPPKPPAGEYKSFGTALNASEPPIMPWKQRLDAEIEPTYSPLATEIEDHRAMLKKLSRSVLTNYMALVDTLTASPEDFKDNFYALATLFNNMHAVINDYRPHQAMATVRAMLESQLERRQSTEAALHTYYSAVDEVAQRCVRDILPRAEAHYAEFERFEKEIKAALEKRKPIAGTKTSANAEEDAARRLKEIAAMHTEEEWDEILYREARSEQ